MPTIQSHNELGLALCRMVGLEDKKIIDITITSKLNEMVIVEATMFVEMDSEMVETITQRYTLQEIE